MKVVRTEANELYKKPISIPSHKVIFMPIAKSASMSIKTPLLRMEHEYLTKDMFYAYKDYTKVTVVRNTYERLVDCYKFFTQTVPKSKYTLNLEFNTFEEFIIAVSNTPDDISNSHFRSQYNTLSHDGEFLPDVVINIDDIFDVLNYLPITDLKVYDNTFTDAGDYREYYTDVLLTLVNIRFKKDIEFFNFKF